MSSQGTVVLRSGDHETIEMDLDVASMSQKIKHMVEDVSQDNVISLPNISGNILTKVIEYCKKHVRSTTVDEELKAFDADFIKVDQKTLFDLVAAANYLGIKGLSDLVNQTAANIVMHMTLDEVRSTFNINNDFTEAEEEEYRRKNQWAFE